MLQNIVILILNPILVHRYNQQSPTNGYCKFDGIFKVTADLSSIIWTTLIIYSVFASIVLKRDVNNYEISYLVFGFAFPLIVAIM